MAGLLVYITKQHYTKMNGVIRIKPSFSDLMLFPLHPLPFILPVYPIKIMFLVFLKSEMRKICCDIKPQNQLFEIFGFSWAPMYTLTILMKHIVIVGERSPREYNYNI